MGLHRLLASLAKQRTVEKVFAPKSDFKPRANLSPSHVSILTKPSIEIINSKTRKQQKKRDPPNENLCDLCNCNCSLLAELAAWDHKTTKA